MYVYMYTYVYAYTYACIMYTPYLHDQMECEGVWFRYRYMSKPMWPKWKPDMKGCGFGIAI